MKRFIASIGALMVCCLIGQASFAQNAVTDWAGIVQPAILNPPRSPASSEVLHTTIQLAMYNATMAIVGGYQPHGAPLAAPRGADVRAAVATAAYRTARIYKGGGLAIGSRPDPLHGTARFYVRLKVGARKDDAVRLW